MKCATFGLNADTTPFNEELMFANIAPKSCTHRGTIAALLVDSGATDHYLGDKLVPRLRDKMLNLIKLVVPKRIPTVGGHALLGTEQGIMFGTFADNKGLRHVVKLLSVIVSGLGRNIFSSAVASKKGVKTIIKDGKHRMTEGNVILPLKQLPGDMGLCSTDLRLGASRNAKKATSDGMVMAVQANDGVWHHRIGHMNRRSIELLRKIDNNGVEYSGAISG